MKCCIEYDLNKIWCRLVLLSSPSTPCPICLARPFFFFNSVAHATNLMFMKHCIIIIVEYVLRASLLISLLVAETFYFELLSFSLWLSVWNLAFAFISSALYFYVLELPLHCSLCCISMSMHVGGKYWLIMQVPEHRIHMIGIIFK